MHLKTRSKQFNLDKMAQEGQSLEGKRGSKQVTERSTAAVSFAEAIMDDSADTHTKSTDKGVVLRFVAAVQQQTLLKIGH